MSIEERVTNLESQVNRLDKSISDLRAKEEVNSKLIQTFIEDIKYMKQRIDTIDDKFDSKIDGINKNIKQQTYVGLIPTITLATGVLALVFKLLDPFPMSIAISVVAGIGSGIAGGMAILWKHFRRK